MRRSHRGAVLASSALALLAAAVLFACGEDDFEPEPPPPDLNPGLPPVVTIAPEEVGDGWAASTPAAEGMDGERLSRFLQSIIDSGNRTLDGVVVARNGRLVAEGYFNGFDRETRHDLRSASKSFTSALAGIAADQGHLAVDDLISEYIPNFESYARMDERKRAIRVRDLLDMRSGLPCDDWDPVSPGNEERMYTKRDWTKFLLDLPMMQAPGEAAHYCTAGVVLLGNIVASASGRPLDDFAAAVLFEPLGITDVQWRRSPDGRAAGGGGMRLRPRDSAKVGELFLDRGLWNGVRLVSEAWVQESERIVTQLGEDGYGALWWKGSLLVRGSMQDCFFALGNGGNTLLVVPAERLVVMVSSSNYNGPTKQPLSLVASNVLPALL
jgi:CubicO group peptidase (beta-lactamase class C family)